MTTYVILRQDSHGGGDEPFGDGWVEVARRDARSDASAIRGDGNDPPFKDGVYVAVPARSWRPRTVKAEQSVRLTIT